MRLLMTKHDLSAIELSFNLNFTSNRIGDILNISQRKIKVKDEELEAIAQYFKINKDTLLYKLADIQFK